MAPKSNIHKVQKNHIAKPNLKLGNNGIQNTSTTDYVQVQNEEIEALEAIYMEDYEKVDTKAAWSTSADRAFKLKLRAFTDRNISVVLNVKFTATYPKTLPVLAIERTENVRDKTKNGIEALITNKARSLLGDVMIHEIATTIQDVLEDEALNRANDQALPTLEQERAIFEAAALAAAKQLEDEKLKKEEQVKLEEERTLQRMVEDEIARKKELRKRKTRTTVTPTEITSTAAPPRMDALCFDRTIRTQAEGEQPLAFTFVGGLTRLGTGTATEVYTAVPIMDHDLGSPAPFLFVVKRFKHSSWNSLAAKHRLLAVEAELERVSNLPHHRNILKVFDFRIDVAQTCQIDILTEHANKGCLRNMLETITTLPVERVRAWTVELLEALDFYHRHGIVHKDIHCDNVLLSQASSGVMSTRLADAAYQQALHELKDSNESLSRSAHWTAPEQAADITNYTRKTDIWDLGIVFLEMLLGLNVTKTHTSTNSVIEDLELSSFVAEVIRKFFKADPRKRPTAFNLIPSEFLRKDLPLYAQSPVAMLPFSSPLALQSDGRRRGSNMFGILSRYMSEWDEVGRLGKGGFGEVVKARNKLDGRVYAIKKIRQNSSAALSKVLSEVMLLSRLNHPYVVRYYTAWPEDDFSAAATDSESTTITDTGDSLSKGAQLSKPPKQQLDYMHNASEFTQSAGLDFISSAGFPRIEFGEDSDNESDDEDDLPGESALIEDSGPAIEFVRPTGSDQPSDDGAIQRRSSIAPPRLIKSTLYIQMEYCERKTLRDLIQRDLYADMDEVWRLFRQILEGLVHIHSHGIIHRDLKPDNIFIDVTNTPKIGDFGLATSGQYHLADKASAGPGDGGTDMTRSIGTTFYVAPELRSDVPGSYNEKVDMYSLGIILFEMCYPLKTAMERDKEIRAIREKDHALPEAFQATEKQVQGSIILSLISHKPSVRPSSVELLRSGKVPAQIEDGTIRQALEGLSDPSSPYYHKMMSALFSHTSDRQVKDYTWDLNLANSSQTTDATAVMLQAVVKDRLSAVFRRHGAIESRRQFLFPRSHHYATNNAVQLLDSFGTLVQLPYDLILPNARALARQRPPANKTYAFGDVFRETVSGGAPRSNHEADFDIVSHDTLDLALKEAETIKVLDEILDEFPCFKTTPMCFHLNHSDLLDLILEFCRINIAQKPAVKEVFSKLNIHDWTWPKIRNELRSSPFAIPSTSLDDLARFDFRGSPEQAINKLRSIFEKADLIARMQPIVNHIEAIVAYLKLFGIRRKVFLSPLSSFNEKFYSGGLLFQCLFDRKRRDVLAAGGRYDRLIQEHAPKIQGQFTGCHAVGFNLGWDRIVSAMSKLVHGQNKPAAFLKRPPQPLANDNQFGAWTPRRCEVLVASFDSDVLRSTGIRLLNELWAHEISAELAVDSRSPEELALHYRNDKHLWFAIIKNDFSAPTGSVKADLKVKSFLSQLDADVKSENLIAHLRAELRDHEQREGTVERKIVLQRQPSVPESSIEQNKNDVQVLMAQHRGKKSNKWNVVEAAQSRAHALLAEYTNAPIVAVETRDEVMDTIRLTRMSDAESWRRAAQSVPPGERQYVQQVQGLLEQYRSKWRASEDEGGDRCRVAFVYNFRTGAIVLYDLGL